MTECESCNCGEEQCLYCSLDVLAAIVGEWEYAQGLGRVYGRTNREE